MGSAREALGLTQQPWQTRPTPLHRSKSTARTTKVSLCTVSLLFFSRYFLAFLYQLTATRWHNLSDESTGHSCIACTIWCTAAGWIDCADICEQLYFDFVSLLPSAPLPPLFFSSFPITKAYMHTTHSLGVATQPSHPRSPLLPFVRHFSLLLAREYWRSLGWGKKTNKLKRRYHIFLCSYFVSRKFTLTTGWWWRLLPL